MVIEMVAGVLIGFGIGYGLDSLFGTIPIFLVLFTMLGFVAGVRVMMRTAKEFQAEQMARARRMWAKAPTTTRGLEDVATETHTADAAEGSSLVFTRWISSWSSRCLATDRWAFSPSLM